MTSWRPLTHLQTLLLFLLLLLLLLLLLSTSRAPLKQRYPAVHKLNRYWVISNVGWFSN
jgi:hypothetical protein